jgi:hypothetical protein
VNNADRIIRAIGWTEEVTSLPQIHFAAMCLDIDVKLYMLPNEVFRWEFDDGSRYETSITSDDKQEDIDFIISKLWKGKGA